MPVSTDGCCRCFQKTYDAALGSSFLYCDCLGICIQRDPTGRMTKQFLRYLDVSLVCSQQ